MFSRIRGFLNRHRRKFIIGGIVISSFYILTRYTQRKIREWQEKEVRELLERNRRKQHFESTERTCNQTILSLAVGLRESVIKTIDTESVVNNLRNGCTNKISAWNKLKILAVTRSAVVVYSHVLLVILLRIQMNLMGGYMFKESQKSDGSIKTNSEIQQKYLSLCSHFMEKGIMELSSYIQDNVEKVTSAISLKDKLTLRDLEQIFWAIMSTVSSDNLKDPIKNLSYYLLPPESENNYDDNLKKMVMETIDLLESEEVQDLAHNTVRSGFVLIIDHISEYFLDMPSTSAQAKNLQNGIVNGQSDKRKSLWADTIEKPLDGMTSFTDGYMDLNKTSMPMAKIIPIINGQVRETSTQGDVPSDWLQWLLLNEKLKTLGANIYEAFSF